MLSAALRESITNQQLSHGHPLPSARELAKQYNLSISTALRAYEELSSQGAVVTSPKSGTRVSANFDCSPNLREATAFEGQLAPQLSMYAQQLINAERLTAAPREAGISIPATDSLPTAVWHRLLSKNQDCYSRDNALFDYSADPFGYEPLREAIANYLKRTRGIHCDVDQVAVTSAVRLDLACRLLIDAGQDVAVENPCFPAARKVFLSHGADVQDIDADDEGLNPEALFASDKKFRMLYLCPSHQDPSGVSLKLARRRSILDWSLKTDTVIWENDFDCNYYYDEAPLPALYSLRDNDTVMYSGSFWLTLGPLASSGFVVLPRKYVAAFRSLLATVQSEHPLVENYALTEFIRDGHLERHIHKLRKLFLKKRQMLIYALTMNLRDLVAFRGSSGMHMLIQFDESLTEEAILQCAESAGLTLKPTRYYYASAHPVNEFLIPFSQLTDETIADAVKRFSGHVLAIR